MFFSYFEARDAVPGTRLHIDFIFLVTLFSYEFHILVDPWSGSPVHTAIWLQASRIAEMAQTPSKAERCSALCLAQDPAKFSH